MRESRERFATISDVNEETFARFVEFMYTGDYNSPQPEPVQKASTCTNDFDDEQNASVQGTAGGIVPQERDTPTEPYEEPMPGPVPEPAEPEFDPWGTFAGSKKDRKKKKPTTSIPAPSHDQASSKLPAPDISVSVTCPLFTSSKICRNVIGRNDYTAVFFCHAQLYVLADKYSVGPLKILSSERLNRSFKHHERAEMPSADFSELVRYIFEHTPERTMCAGEAKAYQDLHTSSGDMLQQICVHFAANNFESLILSSGFSLLLREGGLFVEMFVARLAERFAKMQ